MLTKNNLTAIRMTKKRDGVKAGSFLRICMKNGKLEAELNGRVFTENWILAAIAHDRAKAYVRY